MDCKCKAIELFATGCKCGAFKFEKSNHVWFNGIIYSIGKTADEAEELSEKYLTEFEDFDPEWVKGDGWKIIPDEEPVSLIVIEESEEEETRFAYEWVDYYGPGFLAAV